MHFWVVTNAKLFLSPTSQGWSSHLFCRVLTQRNVQLLKISPVDTALDLTWHQGGPALDEAHQGGLQLGGDYEADQPQQDEGDPGHQGEGGQGGDGGDHQTWYIVDKWPRYGHERPLRTHPDTIVLVFPHSTGRRPCYCLISELGMDPSQSISHWTSC